LYLSAQQASIDKSCINGESEPVKLNPTTIDPNPYETKNIAMFGSLSKNIFTNLKNESLNQVQSLFKSNGR
jgi:hypothetical protein